MDHQQRARVCVIGGGIAGLVTAKVLRHDGFDVTVFEKEPTIGGVWAASRAYPGLRANNPRETYVFSDLPYPEGTDDFPTAAQIRGYLEAYADHFGLRPLLRLSTEVVSVSRSPRPGGSPARFRVTIRPAGDPDEEETSEFDFVAVCNGVFSEPYLPEIEGMERFVGSVLHSSQLVDAEHIRGKRVVVVGAGKSALDCAMAAAEQGASCTLVFRTPHWMVPRYFPGHIRVDRVFFTRFAEMLLPAYHRPSRAEATLHGRLAPLVRRWWQAQNRLIPRLCGMPPAMVPETPLPGGVENIGIGSEFYELLRQGRLRAERARITSFRGADTIQLDTGEQLEADLVVFSTGWRQDISFLAPDLRRLVRRDGRFHLYRHILPPRERRLGFVGYGSSGACMLTSEVAAHWLSQCFRGELELPAVAEMERQIEDVLDWSAEVFPGRGEGYFIGAYIAHYSDDLLHDMGLPTRRTGNLLSEYLAPFWAARYREVAEERRRNRRSVGGRHAHRDRGYRAVHEPGVPCSGRGSGVRSPQRAEPTSLIGE